MVSFFMERSSKWNTTKFNVRSFIVEVRGGDQCLLGDSITEVK